MTTSPKTRPATHPVPPSGRSRHQFRGVLASTGGLALITLLAVGGCDRQELEEQKNDTALSFRPSSFGSTLRSMAVAAQTAYKACTRQPEDQEPPQTLTVNGLEHHLAQRFSGLGSGSRVVVYEAGACSGSSIVVAFRGTALPDANDLKCDLLGALQATENPDNPWSSTEEGGTEVPNPWAAGSNQALVGRGFYDRVQSYMTSSEGKALRDHLDEYANNANVDVHVVGHSLGAISSAIFSQFLAQYAKAGNWDQSKWRQYNFTFNSPLGMNEEFRDNEDHGFYGLAKQGWFTPFGFTVAGDPISETNCNDWVSTYDGAPSFESVSGASYSPFAQLTLDNATPMAKHRLAPNIPAWAALGEGQSDMGGAYDPLYSGSCPDE
ncbi:MAG: hypothetical protein K0V04_09640 [Deltaproteobacteria bacterium]|nr:hypothetical protein [Deltaproteobacteria bacterium]